MGEALGGPVYIDPYWTTRLLGWNSASLKTASESVGAGVVMSRFKCVSKEKNISRKGNVSVSYCCVMLHNNHNISVVNNNKHLFLTQAFVG